MGTWNGAKKIAYIEHCFSSHSIREGEEKKIEAQDNKIAERMKKCHTNEQNEQNDFEIS